MCVHKSSLVAFLFKNVNLNFDNDVLNFENGQLKDNKNRNGKWDKDFKEICIYFVFKLFILMIHSFRSSVPMSSQMTTSHSYMKAATHTNIYLHGDSMHLSELV